MPVTIPAYSLTQSVSLSFDTEFRRQGKMSSRFLNAAGAAAMAAMLALSVQPTSAQITFPWERERAPQGYPQGQPQSDDADAAADRPE